MSKTATHPLIRPRTTPPTTRRREQFPPYMLEDDEVDMRRAKMSRRLLQPVTGLTFAGLEKLAYDTTLYWPLTEIPGLKDEFARLRTTTPRWLRQWARRLPTCKTGIAGRRLNRRKRLCALPGMKNLWVWLPCRDLEAGISSRPFKLVRRALD